MIDRRTCPIPAALTLLACLGAATLTAADWPRWRGAAFDGISTEQNWQKQWPARGPKKLWQAQVGIGYSSVSVADGRLFTMGNNDDVDAVYCLDAANGNENWRHTYPCPAKDPNGYHGTRVTPTVDGDRVYTLSRHGHFFCLGVDSGQVLWSKDFNRDYGVKPPRWGFSGSPLVEGDALITEIGGSGQAVVAFDKKTGKELWRAGDDKAAYSSIVPYDFQGRRCLAVFSGQALVGRRARDGKEIWRHPWKTSYDVNAATPIVIGSRVFISSGYGKGCALLDFASGQPKIVWENKEMRNHVGTCVVWRNHLFGFDEGSFKCLDLRSGVEKWSSREYGKGSLTLAGDTFIVYSDRGRVASVKPSIERCEEISGYQVLQGKATWAVPVLAQGRLYCRSLADLTCLDVSP